MTAHAELRAMLAAQPEQQLYTYLPGGVLTRWVRESPALVRALLEERDDLAERDASAKRHDYAEITLRAERDALKADRDKLAEQLAAMRPRAEVYVTAECHHEAKRAWERERDELSTDIENLTDTAIKVDAALGEDRKRAPYAFEAVKLLREERDALKDAIERVKAQRDAIAEALDEEQEENAKVSVDNSLLKAENERLRAKPAQQPTNEECNLWEELRQSACRLLLADQHINGVGEKDIQDLRRAVRALPLTSPAPSVEVKALCTQCEELRSEGRAQSAIIREVKAERDALKAEVERLRETNNCLKANVAHVKAQRDAISNMLREDTEEIARLRAHPAEPISDELRLRCELAGRLVPAWVVEGHFKNHNVTNAEVATVTHNVTDALLAEGRERMAKKR